jgi:hypothetical protein
MVTEIDFGGQVEKYPADDPEPAIDTVMEVVPGTPAVMVATLELVLVEMVATEAVFAK